MWSRPASGSPARPEPWGFGAQAAYYTDRETGLLLCSLRYYDPAQGRFLNRDPSGYQGGLNLYNCVHNSPTALTDPTGLGEEERWFDVSGRGVQAAQAGVKAGVNNFFADPSTGVVGEVTAAAIGTGVDVLAGFLRLPQMLGHLGEGTECFWDHPSWSTLPGLVQDIGVAGAAVGFVGASGFGAAAEGEVAEGAKSPPPRARAKIRSAPTAPASPPGRRCGWRMARQNQWGRSGRGIACSPATSRRARCQRSGWCGPSSTRWITRWCSPCPTASRSRRRKCIRSTWRAGASSKPGSWGPVPRS